MAKRRDWGKVGEIIEKVRELGLSFKEGAERFGVKPWILYDYKRRTNSRKLEGSSKKESSPTGKRKDERSVASPEEVSELILAYRRKNSTHGFKRIQDLLKQKYLVVVTRKQIRRRLVASNPGSCGPMR